MKKEFRKKVISDRNNQNYESLCKNSSIITQKILALDCIKKAKNIMLYLDFNNEVKTDELIVKLLSLGKTVSSPITIKEEKN
ncbi:5-formyltetrahydrofolate cyclo-ligase [Romboutsia hominis]|uniref:5-formyltetrahydrofolate cyclo-ligase n=1 Tax=Romboutsia hominis TaxID=1507512 RepID=UPI0023DD6607|nr:5-formyltetrahydrofolate cyclo-ligase [Romboutsia hominis]